MMLITSLIGSLLATNGSNFNPLLILISLIGIGLCAASAAAINQVVDQKVDANMLRTSDRPIPQGEISSSKAISFAIVIGLIGYAILYRYVNALTAYLTIASLIGYAIIYTVFLKRATPQNIVIGGLAGAAPPLLGWSSITGSIDPNALLLVLIIFAWTPPHFWALAIHRKDEYAKENIPMLPVTHGKKQTIRSIIKYSFGLYLISLLPYFFKFSGLVYFFSAVILGSLFIYFSLNLNEKSDKKAKNLFKYSIVYLFLLYLILVLDSFFLIGSL